ncbi:uncharacterized protein LOC128288515 [Gossypium arboreum]|uniref:uncharacterized protein LOC128288515 n=1 Tax=Gossypium arboreum TaxID=29729 RepID=UPI0022F1686D|nr:uncharacterized protein LOC128288515 [Gossypium arboreum]
MQKSLKCNQRLLEKHSIVAVRQVCPHRLAVQDTSLSRRQRGFDFPGFNWSEHRPVKAEAAGSSPVSPDG